MSRYMEAITLLIKIRPIVDRMGSDWGDETAQSIDTVLKMYESPGEVAIREGDEMIEECLRMAGF